MLERCEISCGVRQLFGFGDYKSPEKLLFDSLEDSDDNFPLLFKFILFSDTITPPSTRSYLTGKKFAAFIAKNKLGTVTASKVQTNPNTNNRIRVWLWDVNLKALEKWYKSHKDYEDDEDDGYDPW